MPIFKEVMRVYNLQSEQLPPDVAIVSFSANPLFFPHRVHFDCVVEISQSFNSGPRSCTFCQKVNLRLYRVPQASVIFISPRLHDECRDPTGIW